MSALTLSPPELDAGQTGPIHRYPANPDDGVPAGVAALGEAEHLYRYQSFAEQCHLGWLCGSSAGKYPSYISFGTALVAVTPESYTVIPWEEITEFLHTVGFRVSSGEKFVLGPDFTNYFPLYVRLQNEILANVLPQALIAIEEGKEWLFEPFNAPTAGSSLAAALGQPQLAGSLAISTAGIRYQDRRLAWDDVASIYVTNHRHNGALCSTTLAVRKNNSLFAALSFDFRTVPNSFLLTELLPNVCPQRLLTAKQG
jgi:hypothetical protein